MKSTTPLLMLAIFLLGGCGVRQEPTVEGLKSTLGMTREGLEAKFGRPASTSAEAASAHPGGYWVYNVKDSAAQCKVTFDLPHRVLAANC